MEKFDLHILGCGSALPTTKHLPTSQVLNIREKLYMIDCGEGTQLQLRKSRLSFSRLGHIFISHLHGDHCFGLPGFLLLAFWDGRHRLIYSHRVNLKGCCVPGLTFIAAGQVLKSDSILLTLGSVNLFLKTAL